MYCEVGGSEELKTFHNVKYREATSKELKDDHLFHGLNIKGRVYAPDNFHIFNEGNLIAIDILLYFEFFKN